ncbi:hypothetical protein [Bosea sp. MMO-172]|uniref:hypothetical protein n=1 Tax=Bosea sp. MMO-172 TaxID=3127885 RepID=UPI00301B4899
MTEGSGGKLDMPQQRSPAYPYIALDLAVERAKRIHAAVREHAQPREVLAKAYGKPATSSATIQTFATLLQYGLLENVAGPSGRKMRITPLAQGILNPHAPPEKVRAGLQKAALTPPIFAELWKHYGDAEGLNDSVLLYYLTQERGHELGSVFTDKGAQDAVRVYRASLSFAGISGGQNVQVSEADPESDSQLPSIDIGDFVQIEIGGSLQLSKPARVRAIQEHEGKHWFFIEGSETGFPMEQVILERKDNEAPAGQREELPPRLPEVKRELVTPNKMGMKEEKNSLDEGEAILILPENLSADSVADLEYWLEGIIRKARRRAGVNDRTGQ